jgi:cardiolipin synthase A/B
MPQFQPGHHVQLLQGAQEFFPALIAAIDEAQHDVRMETYIFDFTASGADVAAALVRAAQRQVNVQLVIDGAGTGTVPADWRARFGAAGVQWRVFNPLGRLGLLAPSQWRRLHRKLCVVDTSVAFCGGINILDDLHDPNYGVLPAPRFDFAVRVTGPLVSVVLESIDTLWSRLKAMQNLREHEFGEAVDVLLGSRSTLFGKSDATKFVAAHAHLSKARLLLRDNFRNRKGIERAYLKAIGEAHHEIIIANAYFMPGGKLRRALIAAAQRGVQVKLLLQGRYEYFMQYHAARPVYSALLAAGVEIHEYAPSFLHAKVAVVDADNAKSWATVGSSNLDPLSLLLAREANVVVQDAEFARALRAKLEHAMRVAGKKIDPAEYAHRPLLQRTLDRVAFVVMRAALWVTGNRY